MYFIKAALPIQRLGAITKLLVPSKEADRTLASYRVVSGLMSEDKVHPRDFVWRGEGIGAFSIVADRQPAGFLPLFDVEVFELTNLPAGSETISIKARISPVIHRVIEGQRRPKREDLLLDALSRQERASSYIARNVVIDQAIQEWFVKRSSSHGFLSKSVRVEVESYRLIQISEPDGRKITFSVIDVSAEVTITDRYAFEASLKKGIGGARSFGCGLLLLLDSSHFKAVGP